MVQMSGKAKRTLVRFLRSSKKRLRGAERRAERALKRWLGLPGSATDDSAAKKPWVHPWSVEVLAPIATVADIEKRHCSGCGMCANICPEGAISMESDAEGFLYATVDGEACTDCGICAQRCPSYSFTSSNDVVSGCYALWVADEGVRLRSSSGGAFSLLADYVLERGGSVCGAAYDDKFVVRHIVVSDPAEMHRLRGSKYVQSDAGSVYSRVKDLLWSGTWVLFSGCPCQVAGLYSYLGGTHERLITVDLICHGVPSPGLFKRYLDENHVSRGIRRIEFRDKSAYGWSTHMNIYYEDGSVHRSVCSEDPYYRMFLPCLAMRPFCSICKYSDLPRVADFSIGDWWGIEKYDSELNDRNGTSLVLINNERAQGIFSSVQGGTARLKRFPLDAARPRNYTIDRPFKAHPQRARFFKLLQHYSFDKAVEYGLQRRFDIGLYGLWFGRNYGSMITYYALHQVLESLGLSVLMIENILRGKRPKLTRSHPRTFAYKHYEISSHYPLDKLKELNKYCDAFMLGSDQMWNYGLSERYGQSYFFDFVDEDVKKIAYATSFGLARYTGPERARLQSEQYLRRFDFVSVREEFSQEICRDVFHVDAQLVCDPVFLCDAGEYETLIAEADARAEGDFILAYVLDPSPEMGEALTALAQESGLPVQVVLNEEPAVYEANVEAFALSAGEPVSIVRDVTLEEWLWLFKNSTAVVTDSFHGTSFAIIFEKRFLSIINHRRGGQRFISLLSRMGLMDRLLQAPDAVRAFQLLSDVDFTQAQATIIAERERSLKWLKHAVYSPKEVHSHSVYPLVDSRVTVSTGSTECPDGSAKY